MRRAGRFDSGISARYFDSTSLHAIPRGPDPRGASTVLVNARRPIPATGVIWAADPKDDPFDEKTWKKTNPGYGISPTRSFMMQAATEAQQSPTELNKARKACTATNEE